MARSDKNKSFFNILIIGKDYVGLTAFCYKLKTGKFDPCLPYVTGIDIHEMVIEMEDGKKIDFKVLDTKGQERELTRRYFKGADGIILCTV